MLESFLSFSKLDNLHHFLLPQSVADISFAHYMKLSTLCVSQFQLRPAIPPPPPPDITIFFAVDGKFPAVGTLELSNAPSSVIAQSSSAILSILICDFFVSINFFLCNSSILIETSRLDDTNLWFSIIFVIKLLIF